MNNLISKITETVTRKMKSEARDPDRIINIKFDVPQKKDATTFSPFVPPWEQTQPPRVNKHTISMDRVSTLEKMKEKTVEQRIDVIDKPVDKFESTNGSVLKFDDVHSFAQQYSVLIAIGIGLFTLFKR